MQEGFKSVPSVIKVISHSAKQLIAVISDEETQLTTLPTIKMDCPNCDNNKACVWQVQTKGSEESSKFFCCTKCNRTFRETT